MSCSSPTNFDDFESLFSEQNEGLESLYQSPTGTSMASSNSSGTDHSSSTQQQEPITYDVLSDGYAFGLNEFDLSPQLAQKQKTGDLAAANPFFTQTANNNNGTANAFNPLTGFVYPTNATNNATKNAFGATTAFNPQFPMNQLGMYFPQAFPFPQFGGQPFPSCFPNTLAFSSPNTSPIMPGTLNTSPINNTTTSPNNTTTTSNTESGKTKTARRKTSNSKKNTKSSASNNNQTSPTDSGNDTSKATSPSDSVAQTATTNSATTPESVDSGVSSHSDNDSASSSGKKSSDNEKKRKRKTKGGTSPKPEKTLTPEEEKEMKRQRRLIKNRESAQASRERKKVYIQGLEKKVDGLAQENSDLQNHCSVLEQENEILRQRLKMLGEVVEEPTTKKRKMTPFAMKVPIPSNPFMLDFWSLFGMGAMQQQQQVQTNPAMDMNNMRMDPRASSSSRRVVMFIMLFCVAMFLVFPRSSDIKFDSNMKPEMSVDEATANRMRVASRTILSSESAEKDASMIDVSIDSTQSIVVDDEFKKNVADIYSSFAELRQAAENESAKQPENGEANNESTTPVSAQEQAGMDLASQINVVFDSDKISLTFPKSVLVKNEEADDAMVDETQSNATTDGKISLLSTRLLREICRVVRQ